MKFLRLNIILIILTAEILSNVTTFSQSTWQSKIVHFDSNGKLVYYPDNEGNKIPDFSYAGYKNGTVPIPFIPVVDSVSPISGDNTENIQNAINRVKSRSVDANGFRGAILMKAGEYRVSGTILLDGSGMVLRGAGEDFDTLNNTVIYATGDSLSQPTVIIAGGGKTGSNGTAWSSAMTSDVNIISDTVYVGDRSFKVADASPFTVGDNIVIVHPKTISWLQAVNFGGVPNDTGASSYWAGTNLTILYNRYITGINGNSITIDAPIFATFIKSLSQSYIYKTNRSGILTNIGIENLRVDIKNPFNQSTASKGDERNHAQDAIWLGKIEDSWVRHCTALHFVQSGFKTSIATRVTIDSCSAIDPISIITGERRYNFNTYVASQLILFSNCYARYARHAYVSNGTSTVSGIVFYNCTSEESENSSEGHRLWSQGLLYDNFKDINTNVKSSNYVLGLYNRGNLGSGHGWAAVNSVAWNCNTGTNNIIIQKPPTAQNYAIGCFGVATGQKPPAPFQQPEGYIEGMYQEGLLPQSLYIEQLNEREGVLSISLNNYDSQIEPGNYELNQNYPNPFNPTTNIEYRISKGGFVTLKVYNIQGKEISTIVNGYQKAGKYSIEFGTSSIKGLASGIYLYRLSVNNNAQSKKMIYLK